MSIYDDIETFGLLGEDYVAPIADHDAIAGQAQLAVAAILEALAECGLGAYTRSVGWGVVNAVHREIERLERKSDDETVENVGVMLPEGRGGMRASRRRRDPWRTCRS